MKRVRQIEICIPEISGVLRTGSRASVAVYGKANFTVVFAPIHSISTSPTICVRIVFQSAGMTYSITHVHIASGFI